jgi:hypothetical protein
VKSYRLAWLLWANCCLTAELFAHSGGLDANGGHMDHRTGTYHMHGGGGGYSGGSGFTGLGLGGSGSPYNPPAARVRARTSARTEPRTEAKSAVRLPPLHMSYSAPTDPEDRAKELLRLAKVLLDQGKIPGAMNYLKELVAKYPETNAGKEGQALLVKYQ